MITETISIRSIQHYLYCPHRWGLLEIGKAWAENVFVTKADLLHQRVHDPKREYSARDKLIFNSVPVYNDEAGYDLYGVVDSLEFIRSADGITIDGSDERFKICIVEHKPTKPKSREFNEDDLMQVFAQKICVDNVFGGDCEGVIYYADVKKRIRLPLKEDYAEYDKRLRSTLFEMRAYLEKGQIPDIRADQKCSGCSMRDMCMPETAKKRRKGVKAEIKAIEDSIV